MTAIAGFGVLALSDISMLRDFGLVTLIDLSVSLVGVLVALPAALMIAGRLAPHRRRDGRSAAVAISRCWPIFDRRGAGACARPWVRPSSRPRLARYAGAAGGGAAGAGRGRQPIARQIQRRDTGIAPGHMLPPFAVPLALGSLQGDANIATHADQGAAGKVPACTVRGPQVLNVCELYEQGPVVLALFVDGGSCPAVLGDMQTLARVVPGRALRGGRDQGRPR